MTDSKVPQMWLVYADIYGRSTGPYVLREAFRTQEEADAYMKKSPYPCKKRTHDFRSKLQLYPEFYNNY